VHPADSFLQTGLGKALSIFKQLGIDVAGMGPAEIKAARNRLLAVCHPDRGGPLELAQEINAAYELLRNGAPPARTCETAACGPLDRAGERRCQSPSALAWDDEEVRPARPTYHANGVSEKPKAPIPDWAWAGYSGGPLPNPQISRNNFTDPNFFKKAMWELSGKSRREYTVRGYDGAAFSQWITVYGSPAVFSYMAAAMVEWQSTAGACRAVFANERGSRALHLIFADGKCYGDAPLVISHNAFNENPQNDQTFTRFTLPIFLDRMKSEEEREELSGV
jgi:hypothetical protein